MNNIVSSKGYQHEKAVPYASRPRLTPLFVLVVSLVLSLQLLLPSAAHAATTSSPGKFCSSGTYAQSKYYSWNDNGKTDNYYGNVYWYINGDCTSISINTTFVQAISSPAFVSWWDHNDYSNGWWGTGCPVVSQTGNTSHINSGYYQAGYYFQQWLSDNGCNSFNENRAYTDFGPLTDKNR